MWILYDVPFQFDSWDLDFVDSTSNSLANCMGRANSVESPCYVVE